MTRRDLFGITESYGRKIVMTSTCRITPYQIAILPSLLVKVPLAFVYASDSKGTVGAKKRQAAAQAVVLGHDAMG